MRTELRRELGDDRYQRYFTGETRVRAGECSVQVTVPSPFLAELIERRFGKAIRKAAGEQDHRRVEVEVRIDRRRAVTGQSPPAGVGKPPPTAGSPPRAARAIDRLRHRLDEFIVGSSNRLAFAAATRVAEGTDDAGFSPLFLHGVSGLGKTHLLQGIASRFLERRPGAKVRYVSAERFTNEYIAAVRGGKIDRFRRAWRAVRLLCLDDIHFVAGKQGTQQELLYTLESLGLSDAKLVLASDEHPREIAKLADRLSSRFMAGAIIRLDAPDEALRRELVVRLAERRAVELDDEAVGLIVHRAGSVKTCSVRDIEGMLTQVEAVRRLAPELCGSQDRIDSKTVARALGLTEGRGSNRRSGRSRGPIRFDTIAEATCETIGVGFAELTSTGRHKRVVLARRVLIKLARELTTLSFPDIARQLRRPSHSTVVTAHRTICELLERGATADLGAQRDAVPVAEILATVRARVLETSGR